MNTKYKLDENDTIVFDGRTLFRIVCITAFASVSVGDKGGYIETQGNLQVHGNAQVYGNARVYGGTQVFGDARVYDDAQVKYGVCFFDCADPANINGILKVTLDCQPVGGMVRLYKRVNRNLTSCHDSDFQYPSSGLVECSGPMDYSLSCGPGMHFSTACYWEGHGDVLLAADIPVDSILAVAEGKVRCSKAFIVGVCDE